MQLISVKDGPNNIKKIYLDNNNINFGVSDDYNLKVKTKSQHIDF